MPDDLRRPTVLVVDDDRGLLRLIEKALQREGFASVAAASGKEAIDWLCNNRADLMLLDLKLQDIEGKELINHLASVQREVPFIIITGQGDERVAVEMMKRGALDYLVKDVRFIEFVPTVVRKALIHLEDRKRLAAAERQARLTQTVVEQGYSAVMITEPEGGDPVVLYINPAFTALTGCAIEEVVGKPFSNLQELTSQWEVVQRAFTSQQPYLGSMRFRGKKAEPRVVDCTVTGVVDPTGRRTHWAVILRDITEQTRLQREILEISNRERSRIGQDLHDNLGQQLTALELFTQAMIGDLREQAPKLLTSATQISRQLQKLIRDLRTTAHLLSPVSLENYGLQNALRELASGTSALAGVRCEFSCDPELQMNDLAVGTHLYRIAQEAVNNAVKHSGTKYIRLMLNQDGESLELTIEDDGKGFADAQKSPKGMGLDLMRHRASLIGASLDIQSRPKKGSEVKCRVPMKVEL
jgi:PAS domain S-box-containing protein